MNKQERKQDVKLSIQYLSQYKKMGKNGLTTRYRYAVKGSPEAVARYVEAQTESYAPPSIDDATGAPVFNTGNHVGQSGTILVLGYSGKVVIENSVIDNLTSHMSNNTNPLVQQALASEIAKLLVAQSLSSSAPAQSAPVNAMVADEAFSEEEADLD